MLIAIILNLIHIEHKNLLIIQKIFDDHTF